MTCFSPLHIYFGSQATWDISLHDAPQALHLCTGPRWVESPLDCKEKPVNPKGNQSSIFIGKTDAEAEIPILWPPDAKSRLIGKDPDARKDWRQEKGRPEEKMVGWHHQLDGHEFEQALWVGDGQGSLGCCSPWGCKQSDTAEWLNWLNSTGELA